MIEQEHHFKPSEAKKYGITEAIILYNIRFWLDKNKANGTHLHDGRVWTYNSYKAFSELFSYLSASQIKRAINRLEEMQVIITGNYNKMPMDKTKWYSINEDKYTMGRNRLIEGTESSNDGTESSNGRDEIVQAIPDINTDSKQQIINTDTKYSLREKTEWFIDFWNRTYETEVRFTPKKQSQVQQRLKTFEANEIVKAIKNRREDPWINGKGYKFRTNWDSFWRNDEKIEHYLTAKNPTSNPFDNDLPF